MKHEPMHDWASDLWPVCRSLSGEGVRHTLAYLKELMPNLQLHSVPTGYQAFDWEVPREWNISDAYIADMSGNRVVDFQDHNLHVVGYSTPVDAVLSRAELDNHLYSLPDQPGAIPYITSYYKDRWGFCLTENQRQVLNDDQYRVVIRSQLRGGGARLC